MTKKINLSLMSFFLIFVLSIGTMPSHASVSADDDFRAVWVATVLNLDYPTKGTADETMLKREAIAILDNVQSLGMNAVILQVRPSGDAFYPSDLFPWSKYLTGQQGLAPSNGFDPLAFWIEEAHKRNIELHAWINPYRITRKTASEASHDYKSLVATHPARLNPLWVVEHTDGNLYFNPGIPEVIDFIVKGVEEIVSNYDVDGIHFDDYFYPDTTFNDAKTFAQYGKGYQQIADWRRDNVTLLIDKTYAAIKGIDPDVSFGISPFGIWANQSNHALGSKTNGLESYYAHYADTKKWVQEEKIDYIAPQIYWNIGHARADFETLISWWNNVVDGTDVNLYIGIAAYNAGNSDTKSPWFGVSEVKRQLDMMGQYPNVDGAIFFRYQFLFSVPNLSELLASHYQLNTGVTTFNNLLIARPMQDLTTSASSYYIGGASDPRYPLFLNGVEVEGRTSQGYFGMFITLRDGKNTFTFEQRGIKTTRVITKASDPVVLAPPMSKVEIIQTSMWPTRQAIFMPGETITLTAQAPIGAKVNAIVGNATVALTPRTTVTMSHLPYATTFSASYTIPNTYTQPLTTIGNVVYRMTYEGKSYEGRSSGSLQIVTAQSPLTATVTSAFADTYQTATAVNGAHHLINRGMTDRITGQIGDFVRLQSGLWIKTESISITNQQLVANTVPSSKHTVNPRSESIFIQTSGKPLVTVDHDGSTFVIKVSNTQALPALALSNSNIFDAAVANRNGSYTLTMKKDARVSGYYVSTETNGYTVHFKTPFKAVGGNKPLTGSTILLDAGHGGSDTGALGLLGTMYSEKHIALKLTMLLKEELESMGATVYVTRNSDVAVSLQTRLLISRQVNPDIFISIHADSIGDTSNIPQISGYSVFYKDPIAKNLADTLQTEVVSALARKDRGVKTANFYVTRGTWAPSVLIESGFMPNPQEFQWLTTDLEQKRLARTWANGILRYFK